MWVYIKKGSGVFGILALFIFCLYPYFQAYNYVNYLLHQNQVEIGETTYISSTVNEENGKTQINFTLDVTFKKREVHQITVHTLVFQGDEFVGHIVVSFSGPNERPKKDDKPSYSYFETNSTQTLRFNIAERRFYSTDELFNRLYDEGPENFTYVTKLIGVDFTNLIDVGYTHLDSLDYYYDEHGEIHIDKDIY